eukprot:TRINITY_DN41562_c0_g1_i1.p1 TRINITY_DN41562_c0_g1~~TRINITY_DN41562_c0_g1_i1.p1  ORF type:complete len:435 (+),score=54.23 TRINITY_DN41562_c0_g1_i1:52-1356(+)
MDALSEVQRIAFGCLSLSEFKRVACVCRSWCWSATVTFSDALRWCAAGAIELVEFPAHTADSHYCETLVLPQVRKSCGLLEFSDDALFVHRAVPNEQGVRAVKFPLVTSGKCKMGEEMPMLRWPYDVMIGCKQGMVAHTEDTIGFIAPSIAGVVEVPRDDGIKNILFAGEQIFLTMADGWQGLVIHLATQKKVKCLLGLFHLAAKEALPLECAEFRAVATTSNHFILHGKHYNGSYMVSSLRLPDASHYDDGHELVPEASFAKLWGKDHPLSSLASESSSCPPECSVGDRLVLHGALCTSPVCIVCANDANVEVLKLHQPPPGECITILASTLRLDGALFITILGLDNQEAAQRTMHLAIWCATSGCLLNYVDLTLEPAISRRWICNQLKVHPRLPLVAIDFSLDASNETEMETATVRFPMQATCDWLFPRLGP